MKETQPNFVPGLDDYASSEDEDFKPAADLQDEDILSSSEDEDAAPGVTLPRKAPKKRTQAELGDLDSGDEATIHESKRRRKKRRKAGEEDVDSGGEGGLVKTRAQRRAEEQETQGIRKANKGDITIDVDVLWAQLNTGHVGRKGPAQSVDTAEGQEHKDEANENARPDGNDTAIVNGHKQSASDDEFITIQHTYEFAGQTVSEEKRVHRDSAEAKLYLSTHAPGKQSGSRALLAMRDGVELRRPLKRASMFEPNPTGEVKGLAAHKQRLRTPSRADVLAQSKRLQQEEEEKKAKAQRLNTVQKSAIDWASHVDKEGLKDELSEYGRSKQGYMAKMDFLRDVEGRRDTDERRARLAQL